MRFSIPKLDFDSLAHSGNLGKGLGAAAALVSIVAGLSTIGLLPAFRGAHSQTQTVSSSVTGHVIPDPTATAQLDATATVALPRTVSVSADDNGAQAQVAAARGYLASILDVFARDYGLSPSRPLTIYLSTDEAAARKRQLELGSPADSIDTFFSQRTPARRYSSPSAVNVVVYLPAAGTALRPILAKEIGNYAAHVIGAGWERPDSYPYWFLDGFQLWAQTRFGSQTDATSLRTHAAQDAQGGKAPALSELATASQAQNVGTAAIVDDRSEAAVEFIAETNGEASLGSLLKANAFGSLSRFAAALQQQTGMTTEQLNSALDGWLQQPG